VEKELLWGFAKKETTINRASHTPTFFLFCYLFNYKA